MIDRNVIKEKYASMPDSELLLFSKNESGQLTEEALSLLKAELVHRKIDYNIDGEITFTNGSNIDDSFTYSQLLNVLEQKEQGKDDVEIIAFLVESGYEENQASELMQKAEAVAIRKLKKSESEWLIGSVILISGIAITFLPLSMPANRLTYIIAWCAIVFGSLKSIHGIYNNSRFKKIIKNMAKEKNVDC